MKGPGGSGGGGGKAPGWAMRMRYFDPTPQPARIRLIKYRSNQPWFRYMSRWTKVTENGKQVSRNVIGNSHNGELPVPDLLYYYMIKEENQNLQASPSDVVTVSMLENFHKVKGGTSKKGKDWFTYVRCEGANKFGQSICQLCKDGSPTEFGQQYHWSFWPNAQQQFLEELALIQNRCCSCFKGEISVFGYACPECGVELASHYKGLIPPEAEQAYRSEPTTCPHCSKTAMAHQLTECVVRHGSGETAQFTEGCNNPKRVPEGTDPWDLDLTIVQEKVGTGTAVRIVKFAPAMEVNPTTKEPLPAALFQPMEFNDFWSHMSLDDQAKNLGRPNVFGEEEQKMLDDFFAAPPTPQAAPSEPDKNSIPWGRR